jgi:hypothetical protein
MWKEKRKWSFLLYLWKSVFFGRCIKLQKDLEAKGIKNTVIQKVFK